ncbi:MAG: family 16 glycoside hydrolase, partial [Saprospiraceae bacterium]
MQLIKTISTIILFSIAIGCSKNGTTATTERPLDHWVFRSVLDGYPRMITLALSKDLWVSYHAASGAMYKAWKGSVYFDGAVYTTIHGPQPISVGNSYVENKYKNPWQLLSGTDTLTTRYDYKGHRFVKGKVQLMYHLSTESLLKPIDVYEEVEASLSSSGQPILVRNFTTANVPDNIKVLLKTNISSIVVESNINTDAEMSIASKVEVKYDEVSTLDVDAVLTLKSNDNTTFNVTFLNQPTIANKNVAGGEEKEEAIEGDIPEGLKHIAKSDCKTCHNKNLQTIGPAYTAIAQKYKNSPENITLLSSKVKNGGSGVWGEQAMTPHADLPDEIINEMVAYILSLDADTEDNSVDSKSATLISLGSDTSASKENMIPGSVVKIYDIPQNTSVMPNIKSTQKPKFAGVLSNFDNLSGGDFKDLKDHFALVANGWLKIDTSGTYTFHIWSDDVSKLFINNKEVIDNDGLHGAEYGEVSISMTPGYYPFRLEFFQGSGGSFLSFNWKKPGDKDFEVIPRSQIFHKNDISDMLRNYKLPMANVSKIPGDQYPLMEVHPSFDLHQARPNDFQPKVGGIDFLSDGRMIVSTWDAAGSVYILSDVQTGDTTKMKAKRIAFGLAEPLGVKVVNDTIYVMQKHEMTRLIDTDGDDIIDEYQTLCDDWKVSANFHEFGFGLAYKDDHFYATLATAINPGGASTQPQIEDRGKVIKVNKNTGALSFVASGLRTPNGVGIGYKGDIFVADNQGDWLPSSKIVHVRDGAWFGSRSVDPLGTKDKKEDLPVVWLPQDEIGNSPSTPLAIDLGPYKGQMIHGEVTHGGVKRVFVEEVNGQLQGCVFRFIQGLEAGVNRLAWGPGGDLYVGGIGNPGNWGQSGKLHYGLQRLVFNNQPTFEMLAIRAKTNGMEIEFTEPLEDGDGWNPDDYEVNQWYYLPTIEYGGPKMDEKKLKVKSAAVSDDRKRVFIEFDGHKDNHMIYVRLKKHFVSEAGRSLWSTEGWYTVNQVPKDNLGKVTKAPFVFANNTLSPSEQKAGWQLLFDGKSLSGWRNFKKKSIGKSWVINDKAIHLDAKPNKSGHWQAADGGDIITDKPYEDYEFHYEWKIGNCGNSGVMFNVVENDKYDYVWHTGPEMQVLDNTCHPDAQYVTHRAGDLYDMLECKYPTVKPAGEWNAARIKSVKGKVEFWLNGVNVVSFTMHDDSWRKMVANSKFKDMPDFGKSKSGHLSLQDH